jgi:putative endonuclease
MSNTHEIGIKGEKLAAAYLVKKGFRIIQQNWRYHQKEVDIIARDGSELVFVEVKFRSTDFFGDPSEAVTLKKQKFLIEAAEAYLETISEDPEVRFDVVSIISSPDGYTFDHITEAFNP